MKLRRDKALERSKYSSSDSLALLFRIFRHINLMRRRQFALLIVLTIISSLAEVVSLGAVIPFIGILTEPQNFFDNHLMASAFHFLGFSSASNLALPLAIGLALAAVLAGGLRLLLLWFSIRLGNATGADLAIKVYEKTLYQPYSTHVGRSSSEVIAGITQKVNAATSVLLGGVIIVTSSVLFISIFVTLVAVDPVTSIIAALSFGSAYLFIASISRRRLVRNSKCIAREQTQVVKSLQEGLGGIRDVLLDGVQTVYVDVYSRAILKLRKANGENAFINQAPRFVLEAFGLMLISMFIFLLSNRDGGILAELPTLAVLALGGQRLLPLMQQLYGNWSLVLGNKTALSDVLGLLDQPVDQSLWNGEIKPVKFESEIEFQDVWFTYAHDEPWLFKGLNITIPKGARCGFVGKTGSGKSTLLDIMMGLLEPSRGKIKVDGKSLGRSKQRGWQQSIAHVPQSVFLSDASIAENIAFGVPKDQIDLRAVGNAAEKASISDFIKKQSDGYDTIVGERGVRLSGGQRQRIGIARALYKNASILVFDEATSALDIDTEKEVMRAIESVGEDVTIFLIAHRLSTLKNCTHIVKIDIGGSAKIRLNKRGRGYPPRGGH